MKSSAYYNNLVSKVVKENKDKLEIIFDKKGEKWFKIETEKMKLLFNEEQYALFRKKTNTMVLSLRSIRSQIDDKSIANLELELAKLAGLKELVKELDNKDFFD